MSASAAGEWGHKKESRKRVKIFYLQSFMMSTRPHTNESHAEPEAGPGEMFNTQDIMTMFNQDQYSKPYDPTLLPNICSSVVLYILFSVKVVILS
jgi:hypothetical protein